MKTQTLILASMALFAFAVPVNAGPCTTEIDNVAKTLAAKDAGSGPTGSTSSTRSAAGPIPDRVSVLRDPSTGATSIPPRTAR